MHIYIYVYYLTLSYIILYYQCETHVNPCKIDVNPYKMYVNPCRIYVNP